MAQIPASELTDIQAVITSYLDLTCTVQRKPATPTRTTEGYPIDGYANVATNVPCNLAQPSAAMMQNYDFEIGPLEAWMVRFSANQDVKRDDQLLVSGLTLRVHIVLQPTSYNVSTRALAAVVR